MTANQMIEKSSWHFLSDMSDATAPGSILLVWTEIIDTINQGKMCLPACLEDGPEKV
jgi:hypothetical protein